MNETTTLTLTQQVVTAGELIHRAQSFAKLYVRQMVRHARLSTMATIGDPLIRPEDVATAREEASALYRDFAAALEALNGVNLIQYAVTLHGETIDRANKAYQDTVVTTCYEFGGGE